MEASRRKLPLSFYPPGSLEGNLGLIPCMLQRLTSPQTSNWARASFFCVVTWEIILPWISWGGSLGFRLEQVVVLYRETIVRPKFTQSFGFHCISLTKN